MFAGSQLHLRNFVSGEPPADASSCPSGCSPANGACACPVQLDQQDGDVDRDGPAGAIGYCIKHAGWHACDPCWRGDFAESSSLHGSKGWAFKSFLSEVLGLCYLLVLKLKYSNRIHVPNLGAPKDILL